MATTTPTIKRPTTTTAPPTTIMSKDQPTTVAEPITTTEALVSGSETTMTVFPETGPDEPDDDGMSTTYLIIAITLSIAACIIIILAVCFFTYRRGLKKKRAQAELQMGLDPQVREQRQRVSEQKDSEDQKLSTIDEKNQSPNGIVDANQSQPKTRISADITMENPSGAFNNQSNGGTQNGGAHAEPQYVNLATTRVVSTHENSGDYLNLNNTPPNSNLQSNQSDERSRYASMNSQLDVHEEHQRDSVYENVQGSQAEADPMQPEAIYQNTMQDSEEENLYEQALKPGDQIYVDMQ